MHVIKWDLFFILWWLELISLSNCYTVHLREDAEIRTLLASVPESGECTLDQVIAPKFTKDFIETDAEAGIVFVSGQISCPSLGSNPFTVYTVAECSDHDSKVRHLVTYQYDVHVHGKNCSNKHKRKSEWDMEVFSLFRYGSRHIQCHEAGSALFRVWELLPTSPTRRSVHCKVTTNPDFYFSRGELFVLKTLCWRHDLLFELDMDCNVDHENVPGAKVDHISIHWRIGQGSFTQAHLGRLLEQAAQSDAGIVSRKKRSINNSPQFKPPMYQVSVPENKPAGTSVVVLKAVDVDEGEAGRLEYFIEALFDSRSNNLFAVDPANGALSTVEVLDRETKDTHVFRVTAVDHGTPRRTAMATLSITVSDTNDHNPVFEQQDYKESVRENLEIGYEVLTVRATDGDSPVNGNILYRVLNSNGSNDVFEIDPRSGVIRTKGPVDRELVDAYLLLVEANDQGRDPGPRSATATVHIIVEDDNDNAPQFSEKRYVVQVPEDLVTNTEILQVTATDQDKGSNAVVHFSIMSGNTRGQFYIDAQTGKMDLVSQLDYEANKEYTLRIRAQDGGRPPLSNISGLVTVQVLDVNDNAPIFVSTPFQATVLENVPLGYSIIHIQAVDADSGDNSRLAYRLTDTTPNFPFSINNSTGWIVVAAELDRESVDFYNFGVEARDHGRPVMSSSASISMTILDVNDNNPEFSHKTYYMRLNEDAAVGTSVVTVSAVDQDINSVVTCLHVSLLSPVLNQAGLPQGPSDQKVVVVTVDNCDASVAMRFGHMIGNYTCAAQGSQSGSKKSLDLTGPLLLGGVPKLPEDFPVQNRQFVGCIKDLRIDESHVDMAGFIANNGTLPGCSAKRHFCNNSPCQNGATCVNLWGSFSCHCPLGYGGPKCERVMANPQRFLGNSLLQWSHLAAAALAVPSHVEFMLRTRQPSATLLHLSAGQQHNLTLQLRGGSVVMGLHRGEDSVLSRVEEVLVNDGAWHHLQLDFSSSPGTPSHHRAVLSLDHGLYLASMEVDGGLRGSKLKAVTVGGLLQADGTVQHGYRGCLQGLRVGEGLRLAQARKLKVEQGCSVPDPCGSSPCPAHSYCSDDWDSYSCTCSPGYYGSACTEACALNPCEHESSCARKPGSLRGYSCDCPSHYFGEYCEKKTDLPCPRGWWGHKTCGPCSCLTDKGFDSDCNKTSGECRCKDNHYRPEGSESCLLCDCYPIGSFSRACDRESGQCQCKPGVIGRQCDRCDNPFAEVSPNGCEVIYDSCPQAIQAGIWWPRTKFGLPAAVSCPKGSLGTAIRHCDEHKGWLPPNLFNCTSISFSKLKGLSERLSRNASALDSEQAKRTAAQLANATAHTPKYYGSDVRVAYLLTQGLLQHESRQQGFNLTATKDVHFTENLVRVGSAILAPDTRAHWELIQHTERGTAALLRRFEDYANTLAQNMRKTYLSPFTIVTPHIVISVDRLKKMNFAGAKLPRYQSLRGPRPDDQETAVTLPDTVFEPAAPLETRGHRQLEVFPESPSSRNHTAAAATTEAAAAAPTASRKRRHPAEGQQDAVASIIIFHSLAALLPQSYDPDKRSLRVPKRPVINTPVVSITVHDNDELLQHALDKPITVQFRLVATEERSKPICVFWNHTILGGSGGWSAKGCEVVFRNNTHISCQCYHMTSFAVLMDISRRENGEILPLKLVTWSTVGVTLGFLFLTTLFLLCLRAMQCNRTSIINNGAVALFLSELIFILGINQADNPFTCTGIAILLHFFYLCTFSWLFLEGLHAYRMLSELRDINYGPMRFYYLIGWGVPAFITGLAVGLDPEGYGNPDYCWLSVYDTLIWSFAGPIAMVVGMNVFLYILASRASCTLRRHGFDKKEPPVSGLRTAGGVLLLVTVTCLLALLSVNSDMIIFHYLFAGFNCLLGPFIFFFRIVFNKEARSAMKFCCSRKRPDHMIKSKASTYKCSGGYMDGRLYHLPFGDSSVSLNGTMQSGKSQQSYVPFVLRDDGLNNSQAHIALNEHGFHDTKEHQDDGDSDSDSDLSIEDDQSGSYASTHSSDSEDGEGPYRPEECWENLASNGPKRPHLHDNGKTQPPGDASAGRPGEGAGGPELLLAEGPAHPATIARDNRTASDERPGDRDGSGTSTPLHNHHPHHHAHPPQKGILKKKQLSPIAERNGLHRIHNELSGAGQGPGSPRRAGGSPSPSSSSSSSEGRPTAPKPPPADHLNGVAMTIKAGTVDGDSSGSDFRFLSM
ncbi:cadherin EGF LAG seven-pass G-type receptor 2 [Gadus macrocephalus]|uniref:cadherin EGF LAG seven-pass G-type receptor 2 n=1 Tax=Gadus macrocephalus TaxID=80720 RepID=UPI0028CB7936|nr:cadherin EGF LAG seven-pass G-type receptor 2 [Gadus macrocephalus]